MNHKTKRIEITTITTVGVYSGQNLDFPGFCLKEYCSFRQNHVKKIIFLSKLYIISKKLPVFFLVFFIFFIFWLSFFAAFFFPCFSKLGKIPNFFRVCVCVGGGGAIGKNTHRCTPLKAHSYLFITLLHLSSETLTSRLYHFYLRTSCLELTC